MSARLFFVAALHIRFASNGLAIGNLGSLQLDIHAITLFEAAYDHLDVLLAAARE